MNVIKKIGWLGMVKAKTKAELFQHESIKMPKMQLLTVEDLFKKPMPIILPKDVLPPYMQPTISKKYQGKLLEQGN